MKKTISIRCEFDQADLDAANQDIEDIVLKYGPEPAPHLVKARQADIDRVASVLAACIRYQVTETRS